VFVEVVFVEVVFVEVVFVDVNSGVIVGVGVNSGVIVGVDVNSGVIVGAGVVADGVGSAGLVVVVVVHPLINTNITNTPIIHFFSINLQFLKQILFSELFLPRSFSQNVLL
jgi:hypothetical protein